jgi:hypothetical protein
MAFSHGASSVARTGGRLLVSNKSTAVFLSPSSVRQQRGMFSVLDTRDDVSDSTEVRS